MVAVIIRGRCIEARMYLVSFCHYLCVLIKFFLYKEFHNEQLSTKLKIVIWKVWVEGQEIIFWIFS